MGRLLTACLLAAALAACGDVDSDKLDWEFESDQSTGDGTGGSTVVVVKTVADPAIAPLRFRLFPDVVLEVPDVPVPADLDADGREDTVWVEDGTVHIALAGALPGVELPVARPAADVRAFDADGDGPDDLVVLRADGRLDLYVGAP